MELIIITGIVVLGVVIYYNWSNRKNLDLDQDGEITVADAKIAVDNVKQGIAGDIVKVKTAAKTAVKKASAKKPVPKKAPAKKPAVKKK